MSKIVNRDSASVVKKVFCEGCDGKVKQKVVMMKVLHLPGRSGLRAAEGGMLSCFNLCQWPLCVEVIRVQGPVCSSQPCHWACWSELRAAQQGLSFLFKCVWCDFRALSMLCPSPSCPIRVGPPRREDWAPPTPFFLNTVVPFKDWVQLPVNLPVFVRWESRCSTKDLLCVFPSP